MDERQAQIRERAGLEESKLNVEFIDWLRKWGTPLLFVVLIIFAGYGLYNRLQQRQKTTADAAFREYEAATAAGNSSPDALLTIAAEYNGVGSVAELSRLKAADAYLDSATRGVRPGATVNSEGKIENAEDVLTQEDKDRNLNKAAELFQQVFEQTSGSAPKVMFAINALHGLAAVAETKGDLEKAKGYYEQVIAKSGTQYPTQAAIAKLRIDQLPDLAKVAAILPKDQLPSIPKPLPPAPPPTPPSAPTAVTPGEAATPSTPPPATGPVDSKPADPKPADPKSSEEKPADPKPADVPPPPKGG